MNWNGTAHRIELRNGVVWLTLGGVTQPMPPAIAGEVARDLLAAMIEDMRRLRPTPVEAKPKSTVPLVEGGIS